MKFIGWMCTSCWLGLGRAEFLSGLVLMVSYKLGWSSSSSLIISVSSVEWVNERLWLERNAVSLSIIISCHSKWHISWNPFEPLLFHVPLQQLVLHNYSSFSRVEATDLAWLMAAYSFYSNSSVALATHTSATNSSWENGMQTGKRAGNGKSFHLKQFNTQIFDQVEYWKDRFSYLNFNHTNMMRKYLCMFLWKYTNIYRMGQYYA